LAHPDPSPPENWSRWRSPTATVGKAARTELPPGHCEINLPTENTTLNDEQPRPVLTSLEGNAQRDDASQIAAQDRSPSMTARNISDVLTEVTAKLEQFGRLTAELATVCARADDDEKRVAHLIITSFVRPAVTSLLRALNRDVN
jgi:hypothetical protein